MTSKSVSEDESDDDADGDDDESSSEARARPKKRPAASSASIGGEAPAVPTEHGTVIYKQGKINVNIDQATYRVFADPQSKSDKKLQRGKHGGKRKAWKQALAMIDDFAKASKASKKSR